MDRAWIGRRGDGMVVDKDSKISVPPDDLKYTLKRVWLTKEEENGYYNGFANEGIWPLYHTAHTKPIFRKENWEDYKKVNGKFAEVILSEIKGIYKPIIFIQDYHFALLPRMIKNARPDATIAIFWHIPWPSSESFRICPWRKELLDGMLGADLIAFHTQLHCNNFIDTVGKELEALINLEQFAIQKGNHLSFVKPFPISVPTDGAGKDGFNDTDKQELLKKLGIKTEYIGVGIDRLDYTKGIPVRLRAIEYFLKTNPAFCEHFTFVQVAPSSRGMIPQYQLFAQQVQGEIDRINTKFSKGDWKPIIFLKKHHSHEEINKFYKIANICLVTSLHDGMNLVSKEFIWARNDEKGVLILSQFAGTSRELKDTLIVNPYNTEEVAENIHKALSMMQSEQTKRMKRLREVVNNYNVYRWSAELLKTMVNLEP
ncbi:MAG: hypothetical protein A2857_00575 [Candidatus Levybacteria bacterium RIFCSPHIGHO2_01_FULL_36_15]|nr:MAG: hypothetical protein A2857_00575 [Candidatus Levybacteria bacterium RIFCSPHIGHO2_01_FULL_36_15]